MLRLVSLLAALFLLAAAPGEGATYYVDATLADRFPASATPDCSSYQPESFDTGTGTAAAYATLADLAATTLAPGDTVLLRRGGDWQGKLTFGEKVRYGAFGAGPLPVIAGTGSDYAGYANSASGFTVEDLEFRNERHTAVYVLNSFAKGKDNTFRRCRFLVTGGVPYASGVASLFVNPGDLPMSGFLIEGNEMSGGESGLLLATWGGAPSLFDFTVRNNDIHDVAGAGIKIYAGVEDAGPLSSPYGIDIDGNSITRTGYQAIWIMGGLRDLPGHPSRIRNNTAREIGTMESPNVNAFQLNWVRGTFIENNVIENVYTSAPDGNGIFPDIAWGSQSYRSREVTVRGNRVSGCRAAPGRTAGISAGSTSDSLFEGNVLFDNEIGFELVTSLATGNVFNKNVLDRNSYGVLVPQPMFGLGYAPASLWESNVFSNNTLYGFYYAPGNTPPTEYGNAFFGNGSADIWGGSASQPLHETDRGVTPVSPVLTLFTLADGASTPFPWLRLSGKAETPNGLREVTVNAGPVTVGADGAFSEVLNLAPGENMVTVSAIDNAGRQSGETRRIVSDPASSTLVRGRWLKRPHWPSLIRFLQHSP